MKLLKLLVLLLTGFLAEAGKILAIFPYQGQSHYVMFEPLMMSLARAGHSVDVVSHFPPKKTVPGFKHISLKGSLHFYVNNMTASTARDLISISKEMEFISYQEPKNLCNLMQLPQLQEILKSTTKYDVMITEVFGTNCFLAVAHKLKLPVIGVLASVMYPWVFGPVSDYNNPSYMPTPLVGFSSRMSFVERLENLFAHVYSKLLFFYYDKTVSEPLAKKYVPDLSSLNDIYYNMSLVLVNSHRSINGPRLTSPAVIEVAGVHIDDTQKLSQELEVFLNSSKIVYFSMGSMIKSETFSTDKIKAIYKSFSELSDHKVLWKGKVEELPQGLPTNVKVVPWVPQYATLRHPNVKVFVTHGGLMGTLEAIHAGVPMIGIPFFADQASNIAKYALQRIAVRLNYEDLTEASFSNALHEVLTNPEYKSNVGRVSRLFKDRPLSPIDEAVYWVEYVIRNGGESLRSSALHLYWFQYYMIDIGLFLLTVAILIITVTFLITRKALSRLAAIQQCAFPVKVKTT